MTSIKYQVRIVRPVFQSVIVEVDADSEEEAVATALGQADTIQEEEWIGAFEPEDYFYDAECIVIDFGDGDQEPNEHEDSELDEDEEDWLLTSEYSKYILLRANTCSGEGEVLYQPWLEGIDDLMLSDLCVDWSGQLEEAKKDTFSIALEVMKEQLNVQNKKPAKVLPFKRSSDTDKIK